MAGGRRWSPTSREIFYGAIDRAQGQVMIATYVVEGETLTVTNTRAWSGLRYQARGPNRMFDVHPDGTRLAVGPVTGRMTCPSAITSRSSSTSSQSCADGPTSSTVFIVTATAASI